MLSSLRFFRVKLAICQVRKFSSIGDRVRGSLRVGAARRGSATPHAGFARRRSGAESHVREACDQNRRRRRAGGAGGSEPSPRWEGARMAMAARVEFRFRNLKRPSGGSETRGGADPAEYTGSGRDGTRLGSGLGMGECGGCESELGVGGGGSWRRRSLRRQLEAEEGGTCAQCGLDCRALLDTLRAHPAGPSRLALLLRAVPAFRGHMARAQVRARPRTCSFPCRPPPCPCSPPPRLPLAICGNVEC